MKLVGDQRSEGEWKEKSVFFVRWTVVCVCVCVYVGNHPTPLSYRNTHAHTPTTHIQIFALIELFVGGWEGWVESV